MSPTNAKPATIATSAKQDEERTTEDHSSTRRLKRNAPEDDLDSNTLATPASTPTKTPKRPRHASAGTRRPTHATLFPDLSNLTAYINTTAPPTPRTPSKKSQTASKTKPLPLSTSTPTSTPSRKSRLSQDPLNTTIYDLRKTHSLDRDAIATQTNQTCDLTGDEALSSSACYSRFFRNGPLVARERGEEFRREWYVHMKKASRKVAPTEEEEEEEESEDAVASQVGDEVVAAAVGKVKANFWAEVAKEVNAHLGEGERMSEEDVKAVYDRIERGGDE